MNLSFSLVNNELICTRILTISRAFRLLPPHGYYIYMNMTQIVSLINKELVCTRVLTISRAYRLSSTHSYFRSAFSCVFSGIWDYDSTMNLSFSLVMKRLFCKESWPFLIIVYYEDQKSLLLTRFVCVWLFSDKDLTLKSLLGKEPHTVQCVDFFRKKKWQRERQRVWQRLLLQKSRDHFSSLQIVATS